MNCADNTGHPLRPGLYIGLATILTILLWALGHRGVTAAQSDLPFALAGHIALLVILAQAVSIAFLAPIRAAGESSLHGLANLLFLVLLPLPVLVVIVLTGAATVTGIALSQAGLVLLGIGLWLVSQVLTRIFSAPSWREVMVAAQQVGVFSLIWLYRDPLLAVTGLR